VVYASVLCFLEIDTLKPRPNNELSPLLLRNFAYIDMLLVIYSPMGVNEVLPQNYQDLQDLKQ
jgi:hypothetical protein